MKKRTLSAVLLCAVTGMLVLGACGRKQTTGVGTAEEFDYLITVGFAQSGEEADWKTANTESFKSTFIEENGYELLFEDAQEDQIKQQKTVRNFIKQGVDYLVIAPVIDTGWDTVLEEAKEAGIPVILVNNQVDVEDTSLYEVWLGSNFKEEGKNAARWLEEYFAEEQKQKKDISLVAIQGSIGTLAQLGRTEGFGKELESQEGWNILAQQTGEDSRETGKQVMTLFMERHSNINVVVAESDEMALGAIEAIEEQNKTSGPDGDITVISFGASRDAIQAMLDGTLNASFECSPLYGKKVAELIQKLEAGVYLDKEQYVAETYFDTTMELKDILAGRPY